METADEIMDVVELPAAIARVITEDREFARAMDVYKHRTGKKNPTCRDVLAVAKALGYRKEGKA